MKSGPMFEVPVPAAHPRTLSAATATSRRKRKRVEQRVEHGTDGYTQQPTDPSSAPAKSMEYTAVVTPSERAQRRLAGLPLNQEPPSHPFPHAQPSLPNHKHSTGNIDLTTVVQHGPLPLSRPSLHLQHLSAMTAVLHRCMMAQDYDRAARALGLLLRNETNGRPIDIRNGGLWGAGAEILLWQKSQRDSQGNLRERSNTDSITRAGFIRARLYFEQLIIQYPQHKTWPDVVNALDFNVALFVLWIYVTNHEATQLREKAGIANTTNTLVEEPEMTMQEVRDWELEQATQIAAAMDTGMRDISLGKNPAMVRLRAMTALWIADLAEQYLDTVDEQDSSHFPYDHIDTTDLSSRVEGIMIDRHHSPRPQSTFGEPEQNRKLATDLLRSLRGNS